MTLHRLIFVSRIDMPATDLETLVAASARNNRTGHVTGLMLIHQGWVLQAIEGPAEQVLETYRRISRDTRHSEAKVLYAGPAIMREFADWSLCLRTITPSDRPALAALGMDGAFEPKKLSGRCALTLLKAVRSQAEEEPLRAVG